MNQATKKNQKLANNYKKNKKVGWMNQAPTKNQNLANNYKKNKKVGLINQTPTKYLRKIFLQVAGSVRFF